MAMLKALREKTDSIWLFPSPVKEEDVPRDPTACRKAFSRILERAECKHVPFHALRHTFASNSFHYGMDVKMLASTIGHQSVETTLNVYAHATEEMRRAAARTIDHTIGAAVNRALGTRPTSLADAPTTPEGDENTRGTPPRQARPVTKFEPYKGKKRKPGTGYIKQLSQNCWQGRYTPTIEGKRMAMNVYGKTEEKCERRLAEVIRRVKEGRGK